MNNFGFDRVIVLTGEDSVNNLTLEFFGEAGASLQYKDEEHTRPSGVGAPRPARAACRRRSASVAARRGACASWLALPGS